MATIPDHCRHGALPRELLDFAEIYARENLRAYYCQDCLKKNPHRSATQFIFNRLCDTLSTGAGTTLEAVPEESSVTVLDGADVERTAGLAHDDVPSRPAPRSLKLPRFSNLRRHMRTPAQRKKEHQRLLEQRLIAAMKLSQEVRGTVGTEDLVRRGLDVRRHSNVRSSVGTGNLSTESTKKCISYGRIFRRRQGPTALTSMMSGLAARATRVFTRAKEIDLEAGSPQKSSVSMFLGKRHTV